MNSANGANRRTTNGSKRAAGYAQTASPVTSPVNPNSQKCRVSLAIKSVEQIKIAISAAFILAHAVRENWSEGSDAANSIVATNVLYSENRNRAITKNTASTAR